MIDRHKFVLQSYTYSENVLVSPHGETYPACHNGNQAMNRKAEEVSYAEEKQDPVPITFPEIKAEPEVSSVASVWPLLGRFHKLSL
jgi:hypothetical protein